MRKIALIVTSMSVALLAYDSFKPAPVVTNTDAERSKYRLKQQAAVQSVRLPTQSYDPF